MGKRARKINLKQLFRLIYQRNSATKPELAKITEISLTAISDYTNQLQELGWLKCTAKAESSGGRRPQLFEVNGDHRYIMGIDLRPLHHYVFVTDLDHEVLCREIFSTPDHSYDAYLEDLVESIQHILMKHGIEKSKILGLGLSVSGITDGMNKTINRSNELGWREKPLGNDLEVRLGLPVFVENIVSVNSYIGFNKYWESKPYF